MLWVYNPYLNRHVIKVYTHFWNLINPNITLIICRHYLAEFVITAEIQLKLSAHRPIPVQKFVDMACIDWYNYLICLKHLIIHASTTHAKIINNQNQAYKWEIKNIYNTSQEGSIQLPPSCISTSAAAM